MTDQVKSPTASSASLPGARAEAQPPDAAALEKRFFGQPVDEADTARALPEADGQGFVLEEARRLSESILWKLTRAYYERHGARAWQSGAIPSYVTSNPFIANAYAQVVVGYLRDCLRPGASGQGLNLDRPVHIVEAASGSGQFSYLFLKRLLALKRSLPLAAVDVRYVMTDLALANVEAWQAQTMLQPFLDAGVLDFARFDLERDEAITLLRSGETLSPDTLGNPLILFANYVFDSLTQDLFRVVNGQMQEGLITTISQQPEEPDLTDSNIITRIGTRYEYRPIGQLVYEEPEFDAIRASYQHRLGNSTVIMPIGALRSLRNMLALSQGRLLVLASDKGYTHLDEILYTGDPHIEIHGSLSMMVNFHALGQYVGQCGGRVHCTSQRHLGLKTVAFVLGEAPEGFQETELGFREAMDGFGPYDFFGLYKAVRQDAKPPSLALCLALLRLSGWDPLVFEAFVDGLLEQVQSATEAHKAELYLGLGRIRENFYPVSTDTPFSLGRVCYELGRPREALRYYEESLRWFGDHPITYYNMGLCCYRTEELPASLAHFTRSLELRSDYGPARAWRIRLAAEMGAGDVEESAI